MNLTQNVTGVLVFQKRIKNFQRLMRNSQLRLSLFCFVLCCLMPIMLRAKTVAPVPANADVTTFRTLPQFSEALIPSRTPTAAQNTAFAIAINAWLTRISSDDFSSLEHFLVNNPTSPWRITTFINLGYAQMGTGYFAKALQNFTSAWKEGQSLTSTDGKLMADCAYEEELHLQTHLGHVSETEALMKVAIKRPLTGKAPREVLVNHRAVDGMQMAPQSPAFHCGPTSLGRVAYALNATNAAAVALAAHHAVSGTNGFNLEQLEQMSKQFGLPLQMAYREKGAAVLTPSLMHSKLNHYSALVQTERDPSTSYLLEDLSFNAHLWMSKKAVDSESSGYFLVRSGVLPNGWRAVTDAEASHIWGSGWTDQRSTNCPYCTQITTGSGCGGGGCSGMPVASINLQECSTLVSDTPLGYRPPVGPGIYFTFTIDEGDISQPTAFNFSNLGNLASCNWIGYIEFNPSNLTNDVALHARGGGVEPYQQFNTNTQTYMPGQYSGAILRQYTSNNIVSFVLTFPDASQEIYTQNGGIDSSNNFQRTFLTKIIDPSGNSITLSYDGYNRLITITDAVGKITTLSYGNSSDIYKITQVTDPFGRMASFTYVNGLLSQTTDALGLTSTFGYNTGSSTLASMTTPYGTTSFSVGYSGDAGSDDTWIQSTDPLGATERAEAWMSGLPNAINDDPLLPNTGGPDANTFPGMTIMNDYLQYRTTYYWSKHAMMADPGDYNSAAAYQYNHGWDYNGMDSENWGNTLGSVKPPFANRIWYNYPGQPTAINEGTNSSPNGIGSIVQNASGSNISQVTLKSYNALGNVTKVIDPTGRVMNYNYASNGIDVLSITDGSGHTLTAYTYNGQHLPLTVTDGGGQTTTNTYNAIGQILTITDPKGETTTYAYTNNYLASITGPMAGATTSFTYDTVGRRQSMMDSEGYTVTYAYDNLDHLINTTYPDGTSEKVRYNRLDVASIQDREGRVTYQAWDANRNLIFSRDPLGRMTQYNYCPCGLLEGITDPDGNSTAFSYDAASRMTNKTYADGSTVIYSYDLSGRLSTVTDALNQVKTYSYNADDTLAQTTYAGAKNTTPSVSMTWDSNYCRPTAVTDGTGTTTIAYYPYGSLGGGEISTISAPLTNSAISFTYDQLGRVVQRQINGSANSQTVSYDPLGRITNMVNALGAFTNSYVDTTTRIASLTMPITGGGLQSFTYYGNTGSAGNQDQRLSEIKNTVGSSVISQFDYQYDVVGNITQWKQTQPGATTDPMSWGNSYDSVNQLTAASILDSVSNTVVNNYAYGYDFAGNRLTKQQSNAIVGGSFNQLNQLTKLTGGSGNLRVAGSVSKISKVTVMAGNTSYPATSLWGTNFAVSVAATSGSNSFSVIAQDENSNLTTNKYWVNVAALEGNRSFQYDLNGNLTNDGIRTYQWDAENRLVQVVQGGNTYTFGYDFAGRRVQESLNGSLIKKTIWYAQTPAEERDGSNNVLKRFFMQGEQQGGTNYLYLRDHLGSVRELLNTSGTVAAEYTYDPYGAATKVSGTPNATFQYAGYYAHQGTGLNLTPNRTYDPVTGRWLSRDPLEDAEQSQGPDLYGYVGNNPLSSTDPLGLAYFERRELGFLDGGYYCPWLGKLSDNPFQDSLNIAFSHEAIHFEDNDTTYGFNGKWGLLGPGIPQNDSGMDKNYHWVRMKPDYDDCIMREAYNRLGFNQFYLIVGYNCQNWCTSLRQKYRQLMNDPAVKKMCCQKKHHH